MTAELVLDVVVADSRQVQAIAISKKKTDENDAAMLANLLRLNHIPPCTCRGTRRSETGRW